MQRHPCVLTCQLTRRSMFVRNKWSVTSWHLVRLFVPHVHWYLWCPYHASYIPQSTLKINKKQTVCVSSAENSSNWNFEGKWYYTFEWYILTGNNLEVHRSTKSTVSCSVLLRLSTPIGSNNQPNNLVSFSNEYEDRSSKFTPFLCNQRCLFWSPPSFWGLV